MNNMTDDYLLQQMRDMRYPAQVDVVDGVMSQVASRPIMVRRPVPRWRSIAIAAAACALLAVGVNMVLLQTRQFDTRSISGCLTEVYDYHLDEGASSDAGYSIGVESLFN